MKEFEDDAIDPVKDKCRDRGNPFFIIKSHHYIVYCFDTICKF